MPAKPAPPEKPNGQPPASPKKLQGRNRRLRVPWQEIGVVATVAGVVVALSLGVLEFLNRPTDNSSLPPDERLELVDLEFADPQPVAILEYVGAGERPTVSASAQPSSTQTTESELHRPVVLTLRNPSDDTAVLTGVKLVVHQTYDGGYCGIGGGAVSVSMNYEFRFPSTVVEVPWAGINPKNFAVQPHEVDALSITMGPDLQVDTLLWRFSLYGVSSGGREAHWGDGIAINREGSIEDYKDAVLGDYDRNADVAEAQECARRHLERLEDALSSFSNSKIVHPGIAIHLDALRQIAAGS